MRIFHGWFIAAAAFVTLFITVGVPFYGMPFFYDYFIRDFGWTRAQTSSGIAVATILIQPAAGLLLHRFSPRRLILFGSAMLALALAGFSFGNGSLLLYYLAWGAFMTGYVYSGPLPHQVILSQWFRRNRGLAMGFAYLGLGLGGAVSQKCVALPLIQAFGWRTALLWMAASFVLLVPLLLFLVRDRPSDLGLNPDGDPQPPEEARLESKPFRQLLRQPSFWLLAAGSACSIGAIGSVNQHMKLLFQDAGLSGSTVADTTFLILISSLAGRVVMGWMADRFSKKRVMLAAYLFVALPLPLLFVIEQPGAPELFAVLFGFGLGADFMLIPLMAAQLFGANSLARVMGIVLPVDSIAQTCFPFLLGLMRDRLGDYHSGVVLVAALALAGATAVAFLPPLGATPQLPTVRPTRESYEPS
ncbi:MFS transporter [uncultured Paludibaculum sp.]|uniref:MFS transporter n=1 Tax=uncultured Paludibaculum sp. TaxID=1765020 RepID=UPI002AAB1291|nr:MFS transporter [uncultured Paludibaculum sp.]